MTYSPEAAVPAAMWATGSDHVGHRQRPCESHAATMWVTGRQQLKQGKQKETPSAQAGPFPRHVKLCRPLSVKAQGLQPHMRGPVVTRITGQQSQLELMRTPSNLDGLLQAPWVCKECYVQSFGHVHTHLPETDGCPLFSQAITGGLQDAHRDAHLHEMPFIKSVRPSLTLPVVITLPWRSCTGMEVMTRDVHLHGGHAQGGHAHFHGGHAQGCSPAFASSPVVWGAHKHARTR